MAAQAPKGQRVGVEGIYVADENQKQRAVLGMSLGKVKQPFLTLYDDSGRPGAGLYPSRLHLWDENGKLRAALVAAKEGGRLEFYDDNGKVIAPKKEP